jgi:hypothetical protein
MSRRLTDKEISLDAILAEARSAEPEQMLAAADAVFLGLVEGVSRRAMGVGSSRSTVDYLTVRVGDDWKGVSSGDRVLVRTMRTGPPVPGYGPVPQVATGETYLMFLKRDESGLYPFIGFNGFLRVVGDELILNGHLVSFPSK